MAQNARIAALTDELIQTIVDFKPETNRQAYKRARDIATKALKPHQYNRTNQFDVQASYRGLDEKFRVLNRDDLADALAERVKEIDGKRNKLIPEYLNLLLLLADRPTENSEVEALELLRPPEEPEPLTWKEILEEDPYSDEDIWKDIDYAEESSEDEVVARKREKKAQESPPSSVEEDDIFNPEACVLTRDDNIVAEIERAQFWKQKSTQESGKIDVTELQAVRETLFMLAGLQTSLYVSDKQSAYIRVNQDFIFGHVMPKTIDHLLSQFGEIGGELLRLRQWTQRPSALPLIQTFEAAVRKRLFDYDRYLADMQRRYLLPGKAVAISLLELYNEINQSTRSLLRLSQLVVDIEASLLVNPFVHLEKLFEQITLAQMTLETDTFTFLSTIFFECLQTYLKPIRHWMKSGELGANDEMFFVFENDSSSEISSLWHDRFVLRRGQADKLRCPEFLHPAALKIFNTGKSVVFLKELDIYDDLVISSNAEPRLDHETVCGGSGLPMSPFPELFQAAFGKWIRSKYSLASTMLRTHLFSQCGLLEVLNSFGVLYLGANGSALQDFADAVFERMDIKKRGWNDRFLLTELARGTYGTVLKRTDVDKIVVRSVRNKSGNGSVKELGGVLLDYALPWSLMNIIQRSSIPIYQQVFTFLLQLYRAKYLLQDMKLTDIRGITDSRTRDLSYKLRHRLIWFTDVLRSYVTENVIALSTKDMIAAMGEANDIDEMSTVHIKYLARLQEQALLAENLKPIHSAIISILDLVVALNQNYRARVPSTTITAHEQGTATTTYEDNHAKRAQSTTARPTLKGKGGGSRRKSVIPAIIEAESSDSDQEIPASSPVKSDLPSPSQEGNSTSHQSLEQIDQEFSRQVPFVVAGLRTIGRVGADPVWEMLADRLEWDKKKDR